MCAAGETRLPVGPMLTNADALEALRLDLAVAGFDITQPLSSAWYNDHLAAHKLPLAPLPGISGMTFNIVIPRFP